MLNMDAHFLPLLPHHYILRYLTQSLGRLHVEAVAAGQIRQGDDAYQLAFFNNISNIISFTI